MPINRKTILLLFALLPLSLHAENTLELGLKTAITGNSELADLDREDAYYYGSTQIMADQTLGKKVKPTYGLHPYLDYHYNSKDAIGYSFGFTAEMADRTSKNAAFSAPVIPGYFSFSNRAFKTTDTDLSMQFGPSFVIEENLHILPSVGYLYHQTKGKHNVLDVWNASDGTNSVGAIQSNNDTMRGQAKGVTLSLDIRQKIDKQFEAYFGYLSFHSVRGRMDWDEVASSSPSSSSSSSSSGGSSSSSSISPHNELGIVNYTFNGSSSPFLVLPMLANSGYVIQGGIYKLGIRKNLSTTSFIRFGIESERKLITYKGYSKVQFGIVSMGSSYNPYSNKHTSYYGTTTMTDDLLSDILIYNKRKKRYSDAIVVAIGVSF